MQTFHQFLNETSTPPSAIRRVSSYIASPIESCDRCGAGIKYVTLVSYVDGSAKRYGSECIGRVMQGDHSLKTLFAKQQARAVQLTRYLSILSRPPEQLPRGREYYQSGIFFIGDDGIPLDPAKPEKSDITFGSRWFFHPFVDWSKNQEGLGGRTPLAGTPDQWKQKQMADIHTVIPKMEAELRNVHEFLRRALQKYAAALQEPVSKGRKT